MKIKIKIISVSYNLAMPQFIPYLIFIKKKIFDMSYT